ncbi:putative receptor protein kinase ZmPK1 [Argentina anserina]|uniref:putative receptor protein kinase ZmPK1 n=1 Tax=Argentina anserina TaxID=57926 RepID=UPI0021766668|nr:putative receptor protein kinase ZmPK1 [Potentilla anserina]
MNRVSFPCLVLVLALVFACRSSAAFNLSMGSSLSVENPYQTLLSPDAVFTAGFFPVGVNAFCFGVWFSEPSTSTHNLTVVWIANRDEPVNGQHSKLTLHKNGNLVLSDLNRFTVWSSNTASNSSAHLHLRNTGNLVLFAARHNVVLWESFSSPTDTLLPQQLFTRNTQLISSRSVTNYSSGYYSFYFDKDNTLRILYTGPDVSSLFWYDPWLLSYQAGRSTYNNTRIATFDSLGSFTSSDNLIFSTIDYGAKLQRIFRMDPDGNLRSYSRKGLGDEWNVTWEAVLQPCKIHGICGANSYCSYVPSTGRKCSCLPGYIMVRNTDWSYGCKPAGFSLSCKSNAKKEFGFVHLPRIEMYGYDYGVYGNYTLDQCESLCLDLCNCTGFHYKFGDGQYQCYPKAQLRNGYRSPAFVGDLYVKLPKGLLNATFRDPNNMCSAKLTEQLDRTYERSNPNGSIQFMLKFASALGGLEVVCIFVVWFFVTRRSSGDKKDSELEVLAQGYLQAAGGFRRFTYSELKKATKGFKEEIGRGGGGVVYKGILSDQRVAAIKQLNDCNRGEAEFLGEVSLLGKLYHMNLIEMWGYCVENKHRLLVYEYMEHGSLEKNLSSDVLDWRKRYEIALGTAKGLAYLHEECLEWVLHCDVKPQNILLDSDYNPKVADFGLSKLLNRSEHTSSEFSRIRGTRGYMAPEWVHNMPITSKVDVYSYGIVVLEMLTGKNPTESNVQWDEGGGETYKKIIVQSVMEKINLAAHHAETNMGGEDEEKLEILVEVALQCIQEDGNARPSMSQVVEMLLHREF